MSDRKSTLWADLWSDDQIVAQVRYLDDTPDHREFVTRLCKRYDGRTLGDVGREIWERNAEIRVNVPYTDAHKMQPVMVHPYTEVPGVYDLPVTYWEVRVDLEDEWSDDPYSYWVASSDD